MNIINWLRKALFLNSQYCITYNNANNTVVAGIMKDVGYRYAVVLPQEKLDIINKAYRKFTTVVNSLVAVEIILYVYLFIFPYFTRLMQMPYWIAVLLLSAIPLVALFLTYIIVNYIYERFLYKYIGTFKKEKFQPSLQKVDDKTFEQYKNTSRKSAYVLAVMVLIFVFYAFTPSLISVSISSGKYKAALSFSNAYLKLVPINPDVYVKRAFANFKLKKYKTAVEDYKKANEYTLSDSYDYDILGVKTYYLEKDAMLREFDRAIDLEEEQPVRYLLMSEKADYLLKNKEYKKALELYNTLLSAYGRGENVFFAPERVYYNRGVALANLGDITGARRDVTTARNMCADCVFNTNTTLVTRP